MVSTNPPVLRIGKERLHADIMPNWRYRLGFSVDLNIERGVRPPAPKLRNQTESYLARKLRLGNDYRSSGNSSSNRIVIGHNNFGRVTIFGEPPHLAVNHEVWFGLAGMPILPYTTHFALLDAPNDLEAPPLSPTAPDVDLPDLSAWGEVINFRPAPDQQVKLRKLAGQDRASWYFHRLESAWGDINLDYYAIRIDIMPKRMPGDPPTTNRTLSPAELLQYLRRQLLTKNAVVDSSIAEFQPYGPSDLTAWSGAPSDALGALISIDIVGADNATVMVTQSENEFWTFSTLRSPKDKLHPVSGNRRFGIVTTVDKKIYVYAMGADRRTNLITVPPAVWFGGHQLWISFQQKIMALIKDHGGVAEVLPPISRRYDWSHVMSAYYAPTGAWVG
jgi:hypothetical protein